MSKLSFAVLAFVVACFGATSAQSANSRGACKADYDKFCAGVAPTGGQVIACLQAKHDKLSATCKAVLDSQKK
jgi:hypothetical protein